MRYPPYRPTYKQPPTHAELDRTHPLTRGLCLYFLPTPAGPPFWDPVYGAVQTNTVTSGVTMIGSPWGSAIDTGVAATNITRFLKVGQFPSSDTVPISVMAGVNLNPLASGAIIHDIFSVGETTDSNIRWHFGISNAFQVAAFDDNNTAFGSTFIFPADFSWHVVGCSQRKSTDRTICYDGNLGVNTGSLAAGGSIGATQPWEIGQSYSNAAIQNRGWSGGIAWVAVWNRALGDAEMLEMVINPFQMFYSM